MRHGMLVLALTSVSGCWSMNVGKVTEGVRKSPGVFSAQGRAPLHAAPAILDFGHAAVASVSQHTVVISNRVDFAVTIVQMTTSGWSFVS